METGKRHRRGVIINPQLVPVPTKENEVKKEKSPQSKKFNYKTFLSNVKSKLKDFKQKTVDFFKSKKIFKDKFFDFTLEKWNMILSYSKDFRHEMFVSWQQLRKRFLISLMFTAIITFITTVCYMTLDIGYEIVIENKSIGVVRNINDAKKLYNIALTNAKESLTSEEFALDEPSYFLRFVKKGKFCEERKIIEAFLATSDEFIEGYGIMVDGELAFSLLDEKDAYKVLSSYKSRFINENTVGEVKFDKNVEVVKKQIPLNSVLSTEGALFYIENDLPFKVITQEVIVSSEVIPYEVKENADSSMFKGEKKVITKGEKGEKVVETIINKENGQEVDKIVVSETVKKEPVEEVLLVGSKEKPKGFATGALMRPYGGTLTSRFGSRWGRQHKGIDLGGKIGDPIKAADGGKIIYAGWMSGYGNFVKIDHGNGVVTAYGHLSKINTSVGRTVEKGEVIGLLGNTGRSTGPHLHFEVIKNGKHVDPLLYLK